MDPALILWIGIGDNSKQTRPVYNADSLIAMSPVKAVLRQKLKGIAKDELVRPES